MQLPESLLYSTGSRARIGYVKTAFGTKGDGSTDDTAAIQSAIDSLSDTGDTAGTLYFPPGTYKITDTLRMVNKPFSTLLGHGGMLNPEPRPG